MRRRQRKTSNWHFMFVRSNQIFIWLADFWFFVCYRVLLPGHRFFRLHLFDSVHCYLHLSFPFSYKSSIYELVHSHSTVLHAILFFSSIFYSDTILLQIHWHILHPFAHVIFTSFNGMRHLPYSREGATLLFLSFYG